MITCKYCGVAYEEFRSICPSCGAPLRPETTPEKIMMENIRQVCDEYMSSDLKDAEAISEKRMDRIRKSFQVFPHGKQIFLYCDTTPFMTGKEGFLICEDGVYWQNSWTTPTNHNFINWETFKKRKIVRRNFNLDLGKGDAIDMAGLGSNASRETIVKLFRHIQDVLNGQPDRGPFP